MRTELKRLTTWELLDRLTAHYDFQCEGGPLKNCVEWQLLRERIAGFYAPVTPPPTWDATRRELGTSTQMANADWNRQVAECLKNINEFAAVLDSAIGDISWDEALNALRRQAMEILETMR